MDNSKNPFENFTKIGEDEHPKSGNIQNPASLNDKGVDSALKCDHDEAMSYFNDAIKLATEAETTCIEVLNVIYRNRSILHLKLAALGIITSISNNLDTGHFEEFAKSLQTLNNIVKLITADLD